MSKQSSTSSYSIRDFYFSSADDSFIKSDDYVPPEYRKVLTTYKFKLPDCFPGTNKYEKDVPPMAFRETPETLLNLTLKVVDRFQLPDVFKWTTQQVGGWLRKLGFQQYVNTFCYNMINGRKLLLVDACALSAMNIKDFDHITKITAGIRALFGFGLVKFGRSISLPPHELYELYMLYQVKTGNRANITRPSDFWRRVKWLRPQAAYMEHWEILERWLKCEPERDVIERVGGIHRDDLFKCAVEPVKEEDEEEEKDPIPCNCMPPCECYWTDRQLRVPYGLSMVSPGVGQRFVSKRKVLSVLLRNFPERYKDSCKRCGCCGTFEDHWDCGFR